ncbi:MAG: alkaline phosphatase family protein [Promethearchaeota archaeon]
MDGGCFESIKPLLEKDLLPNFKKIIENGFSAPINSTIPHTTIPSWPCLFSGLSVENLGYYIFIHPTKGIFNSQVWKDKSILSMEDLKIFSLNVPGTYPAWRINGEMISGILSPTISCYPKELEFILKKNWIVEGKNLKEIFKAFDIKKNLFLRKMKEDFDLMIYVIRVPDSVSHRVVGNRKKILHFMNLGYQKIDNFLGEIFEENNFDNILIFSDHGLKFYKKVLHFPRWLEKKKLLYLNNDKGKKLNNILLKFYDLIRPFINVQISKKIYDKLSNPKKRALEKKKDRYLDFFDAENPQTFIQKLTSNMGALFLFGEDKIKKEEIKETLKKDKYIENFYEYNLPGYPDFLIALKDTYIFTKESSLFLKRRTEAFSHQNHGFFMAYGKDIIPGKRRIISHQNIAPTILKIYKKEIPKHMRAKSLNIIKN